METFIPPVRPFIDIDSLFRIAVTRKLGKMLERI